MNQTVQELDQELREWVEDLPDNVRNATNDRENTKMLVLCLTAFFVYYSAIINLRACILPPPTPGHLQLWTHLLLMSQVIHRPSVYS